MRPGMVPPHSVLLVTTGIRNISSMSESSPRPLLSPTIGYTIIGPGIAERHSCGVSLVSALTRASRRTMAPATAGGEQLMETGTAWVHSVQRTLVTEAHPSINLGVQGWYGHRLTCHPELRSYRCRQPNVGTCCTECSG